MDLRIHQSMEFNSFKIADTNRPVNKRHVEKLKKEIKKNNMLHLNPCIVDMQMTVIDGQHRLQAAKELRTPIFYILDDRVTENHIASLNSNKSNWNIENYIEFFSKKNLRTYIEFKELKTEHPMLTYDVIVKMTCPQGQNFTTNLKEGKLEISHSKKQLLLEIINKISAIDFEFKYTRNFLLAMRVCFENPDYDHDVFMKKLEMQPDKLKKRGEPKDYQLLLQDIYNYKSYTNIINLMTTKEQRERMERSKNKAAKPLSKDIRVGFKLIEAEREIVIPNHANKVPFVLDRNTTVLAPEGSDIEELRKKYAPRKTFRSEEDNDRMTMGKGKSK